MTVTEFIAKWRRVDLKERSASQQHVLDLCALVGHQPPAEADPTGVDFCFEKGASKASGGEGWADVWKRGHFAWEYKGKLANLTAAYQQLLQYKDALDTARYVRLVPVDEKAGLALQKRTLTNLYTERPTWLANAHRTLDDAVFAAYGWPPSPTDDELLAKLLELNLAMSSAGASGSATTAV